MPPCKRYLDIVLRPYLSLLAARKSENDQLLPLEQLSMRAISKHLDYFRQIEEPFCCLPWNVLLTLIDYLESQGQLQPLDIPDMLLGDNLTHLNLNLTAVVAAGESHKPVWSSKGIRDLFQQILDKGKDTLTSLRFYNKGELSYGIPLMRVMPTPLWQRLLCGLEGLQELDVSGCNLSDIDLMPIAIYGKNLRKLNLDFNMISEKGLHYLWEAEEPFGQCKGLQKVGLKGLVEVTASGVLVAIKNLPDLRNITYDVQDIGNVLMKCLPDNFKQKIVSLQEIRISNTSDVQKIENLCNALPNIKNLTLSQCTIITPFHRFSNVTTLNLLHLHSTRDINNLIMNIGKKLTHLEIYTNSKVEISTHTTDAIDLSIVGYNCVNIQELTIVCPKNLKIKNCQHKLSKNLHFTKLRKFHLVSNQLNGVCIRNFSIENMLIVILSSEKLEHFIFPDCNIFLNQMLEDLIAVAMLKNGIYSNLKIMDISSTELPTTETVQKLLCFTPKLEKILLPTKPSFVCDVVRDFIARNKLGVKVCSC